MPDDNSNIVIFEDEGFRNLLPLTYWRPTWALRVGYGSLLDHMLGFQATGSLSFYCRNWLADVVADRFHGPVNTVPQTDRVVFVNGRLLTEQPLDRDMLAAVPSPSVQWVGDAPVIIVADRQLAGKLLPEVLLSQSKSKQVLAQTPARNLVDQPRLICYSWDLVHANAAMLENGWKQAGEPAELVGTICQGVHLLNPHAIHVGADSTIKPGVVLDAENGPIFIGRGVTVCPNASIEGPCYIGDGSLIQPGAVLRDAMSIGQRCKVGGELESSIIHGFSNKQHDGFLGHAYVAEWVNLAADTVNSDLKNTYGSIRVAVNGVEVDSGQMFVGLTIGDHSKTGIGQMFPTGAVVGFGSNIATCTFSPKFVPSFSWITGEEIASYDPNRCLEVAKQVMARRQVTLTNAEETLFRHLPAIVASVEINQNLQS